MKDENNIRKKWLFPPIWVIVLLVPICAAALITVFVKGWEETPVAYAVYVASTYTLTVLVIFLSVTLPTCHRKLRARIDSHPFGHRYMTDAAFRVRVSLYLSLGINVAYSVFKLLMGWVYSSFWWGAVAIYYILLLIEIESQTK